MLLCDDAASLILSSPLLFFHEIMDFGLACHKQTSQPDASFLGLNERKDEKGHGSGLLKLQRSEFDEDNNNKNNSSINSDIWRLPKMPRSGEVDLSFKKASESLISTPFGRSILWSPEDDGEGQKMLSFSSDEPHYGGGSSRRIEFSLHQDEHHSGAGGIVSIAGGRGSFALPKGPFTPSQWMELEHQALIYKHIVADVPIPSNLLLPLKRSLYSFGSPTSYAPTILGWGPFHLGFSGSNDPEPGRCRRTDGKKWRCSRDAVPDQKYCERHINRGRHRSRKPVEGHIGHSLSGPTTASKAVLPLAGTSPAAAAANASGCLAAMQQPNSSASASTDYIINRSQEFQGLSLIPPKTTLKHKDTSFPVEKQQPTFQDPPSSEFGIISSNSDLNHFMDWPKDQSRRTTSSPWHEPPKPDWTQLSMSIPDLASSPTLAKPSPFVVLPQELDPIFHMGLGVGRDLDGPAHREEQPAWLPIVWGDPLGGPLGEVLSSQLSGSSPTGVLPKSTFVSLSNSSSGSGSILRSSGDHKKDSTDNGSLCNDVFGSALLSSAAVQSL